MVTNPATGDEWEALQEKNEAIIEWFTQEEATLTDRFMDFLKLH